MAKRISDYLAPYKIRVIDTLEPPILTATVQGATGTTRYFYAASLKTQVGETTLSDVVTVLDGNSTLSGFNKVWLQVAEIPETVTKVRYWKDQWGYITSTARANAYSYSEGAYVVLAANSDLRYECTTAGISAISLPTGWPTTIGETFVDGLVTWTCRTNLSHDWKLIGEVDPSPGQIYDTGQALTVESTPAVNDSGRPDVIAIGCKPSTLIQRQTWEDLQGIMFRLVQDIGDSTHRNGDVKQGCKEYSKGGNLWGFTPGKLYYMGAFISVPEGEVQLTGSGNEVVGITITPYYSTSSDDLIQRPAGDEGVNPRYSTQGPDWVYLQVSWVKDADGMLPIKEFVDGQPKKVTLTPERTELEIFVADKFKDLAGDFVVDKFPMEVIDHDTDSSKLYLSIKRGKAYPNGFKTVVEGQRNIPFEKARETRTVNSGALDGFSVGGATNAWNYWAANTEITLGEFRVPVIPNGYRYKCTAVQLDSLTGNTTPVFPTTVGEEVVDNNITWECLGNDYDLSGLTLTVKVGSGSTRTVTFSSDNMTVANVATAIDAAINATVDLVECPTDTAIVQVRSLEAKPITIGGTALSRLGWVAGTTQPPGTKIYPVADQYIKTVTDLNYNSEFVLTVTRSTAQSYDDLGDGLVSILGAADSLANCHDGIYDYELNSDFFKVGDTISFSGISGTPPTPGNTYYVKCRKNYNATKGVRQLVTVVDAQVVRTSDDEDTLSFLNATSIKRNLTNDAVSISGTPKHVLRILRVNNSPGQSTSAYSSYFLKPNTDSSLHSDSQISWKDAGTEKPTVGSTYYVSFELWYHQTEGDFVAADSYDTYDRIDILGNYLLRDCIDFRTTSTIKPAEGYSTIFDYEHYLPRIDKVMLDDFGNFYLVKGVADVKAVMPNDQTGRLTLAILKILPYTYSTKAVTVISVEPTVIKQGSMKSIVNRLEQLEYWKAVTDLEVEVAGSTVSEDAVGLYTNALTGFNKFDLNFKRTARVGDDDDVEIAHSVALDINKQCLLLAATPSMREIVLNDDESDGVKRVGNTLMLDYTPELFLEQPYATESVNCAIDYDFESYRGTLNIFPAADVFVDREQLPSIHMDFQNNLQPLVDALVDQGALSLNETVWGGWNTRYTDHPNSYAGQYYNRPWGYDYDLDPDSYLYFPDGNSYQRAMDSGYTRYSDYIFDVYYNQWVGGPFGYGNRYEWGYGYTAGYTEQTRWRDGVERTLLPGTQTQSLGSNIANLAMVGKVRTTYDDGSPFVIQIEAINLVPNADHAVTIANVPVDFTYDSNPVGGTARGSSGDSGHTYQGKTTVKSDNSGRLTGKFTMPAGIDAGNLSIQVFLYSDPVFSNASAYFSSSGFVQQERETTVGLPTFSYVTEALHEETVRRVYDNYYDPLAQTFVIYDDIQYISEVGVFFRTKSDTLPIRLEVRGTTNGEPNSTILAQSIVEAEDVLVSEDGTAETIFELDTVIGYKKGSEFAIALFPSLNNTDYSVWTAKVGGVDVSNGTIVSTQTNDGVLFHSPNSRVWEPMTKQDLKFKLYRCNFRDDAYFVFNNITGINASSFVLAVEEFAAPGTDIKWFYRPYWTESSPEANDWVAFYPNIDTYLETELRRVDLKGVVTSLGGSYQLMNPYSGIVFLLHKPSGWAVCPNEDFSDILNLPNTVKCYVDLSTDITGPLGLETGRTVTPYFSYDNGNTLVEIDQDPEVEPTTTTGIYSKFTFSTPSQATIQSTDNATASGPIVCNATNHKFKENAKVTISGVSGDDNANGTFVIRDVTANTFSLYHPLSKQPIVGTGLGTGGTVVMAEIDMLRPFLLLETSNTVRTPRVMNISFIASKV